MSSKIELIRRQIQLAYSEVEHEREDMHPYQSREMYDFFFNTPFAAGFIDMGLGKTVSALTIAVDLISSFQANRVLISAPLKVAVNTWPNEKRKWRHLAGFDHVLLREDEDDPRIAAGLREQRAVGRSCGLKGPALEKFVRRGKAEIIEKLREEIATAPASIHIINHDRLVWLCDFWRKRKQWPYQAIILDESSGFRAHDSERFKALAAVRRTKGLVNRIIELTATPKPEGYIGLWAQFYLLDLGERLGKNITAYRKKHFTHNIYRKTYDVIPGHEDEIIEKISDITLVMKAKDYLPHDEPLFLPRYVELPKKVQDLYSEMEDEFVVKVGDAEIEAVNTAALSGKLQQMASGFLYETYLEEDFETFDMRKVRKTHFLHDEKIQMLKQLIEDLDGEPLIVAFWFKASLDALVEAFPKMVVLDKEASQQDAWNARKIQLLAVHPRSAGHGLNLQKGGTDICPFDLWWPQELWIQLIGRLNRQGKIGITRVHPIIAKGTVDERVWKGAQDKGDEQEKFFRKLRRRIADRRKKIEQELRASF